MNKLIGVWNYDFDSLPILLQIWGLILALGFIIVLGFLLASILCKFLSAEQWFLIALIPSTCCILGSGNLTISGIVIMGYVIAFICYCSYLIWDSYIELNRHSYSSNAVNMDFQTFKNLYDLNPKRFSYISYEGRWEYNVPWSKEEYDEIMGNPWRMDLFKKKVYITITDPKEFAKYYKWNKQRLKQEEKDEAVADRAKRHRANVENMQLILNQAQMDIDALKKQADKEIATAADISKQVKERMG